MIELSEDIEYIDEIVDRLKKRNNIDVCELYTTIARLLEAKALLVSVQQDAEMSLEDLQSED